MAAMFLLLLVSTAKAHSGAVFDVRKYGAKADGKSDISKVYIVYIIRLFALESVELLIRVNKSLLCLSK